MLKFPRPSPSQTRRTVDDVLYMNPITRTRQLINVLVSKYGSRLSLATVQKSKYNFNVQRNPFGRHLDGLILLPYALSRTNQSS